MKSLFAICVPLFLIACASSNAPPPPGRYVESVRDFIDVNQLTEVDMIRHQEQTKYLYVNEYFVVMPAGRDHYLIEFRSPCDAMKRRNWTGDMIDIRVSARVLHADHDTLRGCNIDKIYELSKPQLEELSTLKPVITQARFGGIDTRRSC
jgi:hypothetical protein